MLLEERARTTRTAVSVTIIAARIAIPVIVLPPLLIASIPPLVVRGVAALALGTKGHPGMVRLRAAVTVFAHFFGEFGFGFLSAPLALFHAFAVSSLILVVLIVSILPVGNLRNCNAGEKQQQSQS
ncbi:MAG: hypothetical protein ACYC92_03500 [Candidatus Acidiferrales bacterium]